MNEENLRILAAFLRKYAAGETDVKAEFNMVWFTDCKGGNRTDCGTAGCAVGFAPFAGFPKKESEGWAAYSKRLFIDDSFQDAFDWCFTSSWSELDNTPLGAAQRIEMLLDSGLPENWKAQMKGEAPLSYKDL